VKRQVTTKTVMVAAFRLHTAESFEYLHSDGVATESVEDVGGAGEVGHELVGARVGDAVDLSVVRPAQEPTRGGQSITVSSSRPCWLANDWRHE